MKRSMVLGALLVLGVLSIAIAAQQAQPEARVIDVEKVKDNLYVLKGGGGNTSVFITSTGVVVVDAKNPGWGQPILDKIKTLTNKPITTLINTHTHGDHVSGNVEFPASVDIIVQENTAANMKKMIPNSASADQAAPAKTIFDQNNGRGLPKKTFKDRMTLFSGPDRVELYYFGRGHTNGDAWVLFPALRVVQSADIFLGKAIPILDANNGGSAVDIATSLQKAYDNLKDVDVIVTGHGGTGASTSSANALATRAELLEYIAFNRDFLNDVRAAKNAGKTADEVASTWKVPAKYAANGYVPADPARLKNNVALAYKELGAK